MEDIIQNNMEKIEQCLNDLISNPYNDNANFCLGYEYEEQKQFSSALCYYLRCADLTNNNILASEALLRASLCIGNLGNKDTKELYLIKHSISVYPQSIEPYYIASLYYSFRNQWLNSYLYACLGLNNLKNNLSPRLFIKKIKYNDKSTLLFQKAYSGTNIGKIDEARKIYIDLLQNYKLGNFREKVINNYNYIPDPYHNVINYSHKLNEKLIFKFNNYEKIERNFSQIYQDIFILSMHDGKKNGIYLEIGAGDYMKGNNTYLLETNFSWKGISVDIDKNYVDYFNKNRINKCICDDATKINYEKLLQKYDISNIDYLQLDCDPPNITYEILLTIPFNKYKFGVITYEHDFYNDITGEYRQKSRDFLLNKGYKLIAGNISPYKDDNPFEDWWIHPELIEKNIYSKFLRKDDISINGEKYMLI